MPFGSITEADLLAVAAGVETGSSHPLAIAILNKAKRPGLPLCHCRDHQGADDKEVSIATVGEASWLPRRALRWSLADLMASAWSHGVRGGQDRRRCFPQKDPTWPGVAMRDERADAKAVGS